MCMHRRVASSCSMMIRQLYVSFIYIYPLQVVVINYTSTNIKNSSYIVTQHRVYSQPVVPDCMFQFMVQIIRRLPANHHQFSYLTYITQITVINTIFFMSNLSLRSFQTSCYSRPITNSLLGQGQNTVKIFSVSMQPIFS